MQVLIRIIIDRIFFKQNIEIQFKDKRKKKDIYTIKKKIGQELGQNINYVITYNKYLKINELKFHIGM